LEGIDAIDVYGYAVLINGEKQKLPYPLHNGKKAIGRSFHHGRFVQALRKAAASLSNVSICQGTASKLLEDDEGVIGVSYKENENTKQVFAPLTIVCDGCFSNFRKQLGADKPENLSNFVGVILENCSLPFPNHGHVFLADPAPILGYQIGSNEIRILIDIPNPLPNSANGELVEYLTTKTVESIPEALRPSFLESTKNGKVRSMPNSVLHPSERCLRPGVILLGDAWNMRHPLTGGGMTVALSDVVIIRNIVKTLNFEDRKFITSTLQSTYLAERKPLASTSYMLAVAL